MSWCGNKYSAKKTYSELCGRNFDSKAEARRGEELELLQKAGEIRDLQYQVRFISHRKPIITIKLDFVYKKNYAGEILGETIYEDVKGMETREFRVKRFWLEEQQGIKILLTK